MGRLDKSVTPKTHKTTKKIIKNTKKHQKMTKLEIISLSLIILSNFTNARLNFNRNTRSKRSFWRRPYSYYTDRYTDRRAGEIKEEDLLAKLQQSENIIIDTRTAEERANSNIENLNVPENAKYIVVAYDNFFDAEHFFQSFKKGSDWYDDANDGNDVDIFSAIPEDFDFTTQPINLPEEVKNLGSKISLICGSRWCGCRWNVAYDHGIRGHSWYDDDINDFINSQS